MRKSILLSSVTPMASPMVIRGVHDNILTPIIGDIYAALKVVSREMVGYIPSVGRNSTAERAAVGQTVTYPIVGSTTSKDTKAQMAITEPDDHDVGAGQMTIQKSKGVDFGFTGEEELALSHSVGYLSVQAQLIAQAFRTLVNEVELDCAIAAAAGASRAYGTPGVTPFSSKDLTDVAQVRKILDDNGAPPTGRSLILNTSAGAALRAMPNLTRVNEAGDFMTLRDGTLTDVHDFAIKETGRGVTHTPGDASGATTDGVAYPIGSTVITLAAAGTGEIKAGDIISFAGDDSKYVVSVGLADVSAGGAITIAGPGLRVAIDETAVAVTVVTTAWEANAAFSVDAIQLAARKPALPSGRDAAIDAMDVTDPRSGLTFEIRVYAGQRKMKAEVSLAWGVKVVNPEHTALLLG